MIDATLATAEREAGFDLALAVTNGGDEPVTLRFRTGQRADFAAYEAGDDAVGEASDGGDDGDEMSDAGDAAVPETEPVWRHGAGRLFTQALDSETLAPGESATYEGTWRDPPPGVYLVVGTLTAEESEATATATLAIE